MIMSRFIPGRGESIPTNRSRYSNETLDKFAEGISAGSGNREGHFWGRTSKVGGKGSFWTVAESTIVEKNKLPDGRTEILYRPSGQVCGKPNRIVTDNPKSVIIPDE